MKNFLFFKTSKLLFLLSHLVSYKPFVRKNTNISGINKNRLTAKGYGETQLVNNCADGVSCSEAEHQLNRRSTFVIVGE